MPTLGAIKSPYARSKPPLGSQVDWSHPLACGLVGIWAFNEGSGLAAFDGSGYSNQGILTNGPIWAGEGIKFDGTNDYVNGGTNPVLHLTGNYSIIVSVFPLSFAALQNVIFKGNVSGGTHLDYGMFINVATGVWAIQQGATGAGNINGGTLTTGAWWQLAVTRDTVNCLTYTNGVFNNSGATNLTAQGAATDSTTIGADIINSRYFTGYIRYCYIYNYSLSGSMIKWLNQEPYAMFRGSDAWKRIPIPYAPKLPPGYGPLGYDYDLTQSMSIAASMR